jgi:hypothetical protein
MPHVTRDTRLNGKIVGYHSHILIWLVDKIRQGKIDNIISAKIPDLSTDQLLFDIVTTNIIHIVI